MQRLDAIRLFLCGDVMTGRGIDQILPAPCDPTLHEPYIRDARSYVDLAERVSGAIPRGVGPHYIWGDALEELDRADVDLRIVNLETSITQSENYWVGKQIHYRMSPENIRCLTSAGITCCCLANNHVLDWGYDGLHETLRTLKAAGIIYVGAGRNAEEAAAPATFEIPGKGRVLVFSYGMPTSGIPWEWRATDRRPGVNLLDGTSGQSVHRISEDIRRSSRKGDVVVVSIHWGDNWGYEISKTEIEFAHRLIEEGASVVYGHSSHHVKTVELYRGGLVLYGCGDFLNDYEGISGYESYRSDLTLMYLAAINPQKGRLAEARLIPMRIGRFRLNRATLAEAVWLRDRLSELGEPLGTRIELSDDDQLMPRVVSKL